MTSSIKYTALLLLVFSLENSCGFRANTTIRPTTRFVRQTTHDRTSSTTLKAHTAVAVPAVSAALGGIITGGVFAGGLHAIAGPDHLAALLPRTVGQRWYKAGRTGALWGVGHGISVTLLGLLGYLLKSKISMSTNIGKILHGASHCLEAAVGVSLVVIGLLGIKEAREWEAELEESGALQSLSAGAVEDHIAPFGRNRAIVFNGLLHGFSWDGAPSLAPALAVASWRSNIAFLLAYGVGTMVTMALTTTFIGEGTRRAGKIFHRPDLPQKLSLFSSIFAIAIGCFWTYLAFA